MKSLTAFIEAARGARAAMGGFPSPPAVDVAARILTEQSRVLAEIGRLEDGDDGPGHQAFVEEALRRRLAKVVRDPAGRAATIDGALESPLPVASLCNMLVLDDTMLARLAAGYAASRSEDRASALHAGIARMAEGGGRLVVGFAPPGDDADGMPPPDRDDDDHEAA